MDFRPLNVGPPWKTVQALIRSATEDAEFNVLEDTVENRAAVYSTLRTLQTQARAAAADGRVLTSSMIGGNRFDWQPSAGGGPEELVALVERALQAIDGKTIPEMRALLKSYRRLAPDFTTFRP